MYLTIDGQRSALIAPFQALGFNGASSVSCESVGDQRYLLEHYDSLLVDEAVALVIQDSPGARLARITLIPL